MAGRKKSKARPRSIARRTRVDAAHPARPSKRPSASKVENGHPALTIAGIGASAGGLEAFTQFLQALPNDTGMAFVLVQHLGRRHDSILPHLLGGASRLPVVQVTDGIALEPEHVYVIPPDAYMGIAGGVLRLITRSDEERQFLPINFFFRSLADYAQNRSIGVILSGTASDGAAGLREIKAVGGITIAQTPATAKYDGMPRAAISTGIVDLVLSPEEIAAELARISRHPYVRHVRSPKAEEETRVLGDDLYRILVMLRGATGVDFTQYKQPTIERRLQRRMALNRIDGMDHYRKLLEEKPDELKALSQDILIHVTQFFREPGSFEALTEKVFPKIAEARQGDNPIRVWIPGCATGEEAYSIAIALLELASARSDRLPIQIFATDVSESAIASARAGVYPQSIAADVSKERLRRFFTDVDGSYRINKSVRDLCIFARQDLTRDPPFSKLDLIVCRNVLIYMSQTLQKRLINTFHYSLKSPGYLLLANAETVGPYGELFARIDRKLRLYLKREVVVPADMHFPPETARYAPPKARPRMAGSASLRDEVDRLLLSRYTPVGVVIDENFQILEFRGHTGRFLEPADGEPSLNLLKMGREGLLYGVRTAVHEARKTRAPVEKPGLKVRIDRGWSAVNLHVVPLSIGNEAQYHLVLFEEVETAVAKEPTRQRGKRKAPRKDGRSVERLEEELAASRDYLQSIIQDLEAANEELQSANEEVLSANEELHSTNEELDTAKEELQSTNEELNTLNEELQGRNDELSRVNSDLMNLLGSMQSAIVMVTADMRIRRFTPMAEKVLNLIGGDVGRPISHIKPNIDCPDLEQLIAEVVDSVAPVEREVRDAQGSWFLLRIRPYKNVENRIDGAVLTLLDIDAVKRHQAEQRAAQEYCDAVADMSREALVVVDANMHVRTVNQAFCQLVQTSRETAAGRHLDEVWSPIDPKLHSLLGQLPKDGPVGDIEIEHELPKLGRRKLLVHARRFGGDHRPPMLMIRLRDVTEAKGSGAAT